MDRLSTMILNMFSRRQSLTISQLAAILNRDPSTLFEFVLRLKKKEFLRIEPNHAILKSLDGNSSIKINTPLQITPDGRTALEEEMKAHWAEIRAWVTLIITMAKIAVTTSGILKKLFISKAFASSIAAKTSYVRILPYTQ